MMMRFITKRYSPKDYLRRYEDVAEIRRISSTARQFSTGNI